MSSVCYERDFRENKWNASSRTEYTYFAIVRRPAAYSVGECPRGVEVFEVRASTHTRLTDAQHNWDP